MTCKCLGQFSKAVTNAIGLHPLCPPFHPISSIVASSLDLEGGAALPDWFLDFYQKRTAYLISHPQDKELQWGTRPHGIEGPALQVLQPYRSYSPTGMTKDLGQISASALQSLTPVAAMNSTAKEVIKQTKARIKGIMSPPTHTEVCLQLSERSFFHGPWSTLSTHGHHVSSLHQ